MPIDCHAYRVLCDFYSIYYFLMPINEYHSYKNYQRKQRF